jgi:hypothetical protein
MFEPRTWTMIVLSSLIAAPALWLITAGSVLGADEVRSGPTMYQLVSASSTDTGPLNIKGLMTADRHLSDPRNGSDFPVTGRYQFARQGAPEIASNAH